MAEWYESKALGAHEAQLASTFETELAEELRLFDLGTHLLVAILQGAGTVQLREVLDEKGNALKGSDLKSQIFPAQVVIGARALRVVRATRAVLAVGYEWEAQTNVRILQELLAHRDAIRDDESGMQAARWLAAIRRSGKGIIDAGGRALYENLSRDSHGDPTTVMRLLDPSGSRVELEPKRTHRTAATLVFCALTARDQAVLIAAHGGKELKGTDGYDAFEHDLLARWSELGAKVPDVDEE